MPLMDANLDRSARRRWLKATAAAAVCIATGSAVSQPAWPAKPIRLVVPFTRRGPPDPRRRLIPPQPSRRLAQQLLVAHRPPPSPTLRP